MQPTYADSAVLSGDWIYTSEPSSSDALYEISYKGDYVEVLHLKSFKLKTSVAEAIWDEALALCKVFECRSILRSGPPPVRDMAPADVMAVGARLDIPGLKVAYCWDDYRPDRINALFAIQALENEVTVRFFCDCEAAIEWLSSE